MRSKWSMMRYDLQYLILNQVVCKIPCWTTRKLLYRQLGMQIGKDARIGIGTVVMSPQNIKIENCVLDGRGGLSIGQDTSISMFCKILSASHDMDSPDFAYRTHRTVIGSNVWVGTSATVLDGTKVRNFAVIGAGAVVKNVVKERSVVVGNPAMEIRKRRMDRQYCLEYKAYFR